MPYICHGCGCLSTVYQDSGEIEVGQKTSWCKVCRRLLSAVSPQTGEKKHACRVHDCTQGGSIGSSPHCDQQILRKEHAASPRSLLRLTPAGVSRLSITPRHELSLRDVELHLLKSSEPSIRLCTTVHPPPSLMSQ